MDWKGHVVCIPFPAQGHITPMMKLAKLLHHHGFLITFVNTHFNHNRLLKSGAVTTTTDIAGFRFVSIPDGLPPSDEDSTQDILLLGNSFANNFLSPFRDLLLTLVDPIPPTCIVADSGATFAINAGRELGIPVVMFCTLSAAGTMCYLHYQKLLDAKLVPLKCEEDLVNGYLDTPVDWVPGMKKNMRLRDFPSFVRTTDADDELLRWCLYIASRLPEASAVIFNTFDALEGPVVEAMRALLSCPVYTIGPLDLLIRSRVPPERRRRLGSNLWKEDAGCLEWLDGMSAAAMSVVYVNFGSITVMTREQLVEFAWGLAGSGHCFLWIIRPDVVKGPELAGGELPPEFMAATERRGKVVSWCPQEEVLRHPAVGAFMTHCGWNSVIESVGGGGVPMICWPFFAEQPTNCRLACTEWGIAVEMTNGGGGGGVVRREEVEAKVREVMGGGAGKGEELRASASRWKELAAMAAEKGGSSLVNFDRLVNDVLLPPFDRENSSP